jgi:hypothetical protein
VADDIGRLDRVAFGPAHPILRRAAHVSLLPAQRLMLAILAHALNDLQMDGREGRRARRLSGEAVDFSRVCAGGVRVPPSGMTFSRGPPWLGTFPSHEKKGPCALRATGSSRRSLPRLKAAEPRSRAGVESVADALSRGRSQHGFPEPNLGCGTEACRLLSRLLI